MIIASVIAYGALFWTAGASVLPPALVHSAPQSFIVKLKSGFEPHTHLSAIRAKTKTRIGKTTLFDSRVFHGYVVELDPADQAALARLEEVEYIEPDVVVSVASDRVQTDAPWGLQAITRSTPFPFATTNSPTASSYLYEEAKVLEIRLMITCVDIYIFDSGVYWNHTELINRVQRSPVFARYTTEGDVFGHGTKVDSPIVLGETNSMGAKGTHVAGIAAGTRCGVAKKAQVIDVKVITDTGRGFASDIIQGLAWAVSNINSTSRSSVFNLSLGGGTSTALDDAVTAVSVPYLPTINPHFLLRTRLGPRLLVTLIHPQTVNAGIHVVVAAGNGAVDASDWSPARVPGAIAVGNVDINGVRAESSNYGGPVAVFAPGVDIISAGTSEPNATRVDSGTSMAAPHVAGLVAYLLAFEGPRTPAEMKTRVQSLALTGVLSNIRKGYF
ncbi:subtilisin-like serine protease [Ceratobasidium sp. 414]|nr:subtilisin-like serine protease [Ceratobasidium sp. 414]